jgi:hypothetical protein
LFFYPDLYPIKNAFERHKTKSRNYSGPAVKVRYFIIRRTVNSLDRDAQFELISRLKEANEEAAIIFTAHEVIFIDFIKKSLDFLYIMNIIKYVAENELNIHRFVVSNRQF